MLRVEDIERALARTRPRSLSREGRAEAGVALLLRERRAGPELLFIERAERAGDPWSGHMAFPGGGRDPRDPDVQRAAERETLEEVGISLAGSPPLGRLPDLEGRHGRRPLPLVISAFVYAVEPPGPPRLNHEVRHAFWFPVAELLDPSRHVEHVLEGPGGPLRFPGICIGDPERHVVWGLTYRFLQHFFEVLGRPLPRP